MGNPFANWSLVCNRDCGGNKQMSDEVIAIDLRLVSFMEEVEDDE